MKRFETLFGILILLFAVGFNLYTYRAEPTAKTDPNDNTFQYALVDRTNQIWDYAQQKCSGITTPFCTLSLLTDHWVPNWAQGYNLPYYYSHVPQILIVGSFRIYSLFHTSITLFTYYHWVIYLLLCLFPVTIFLSLRIIGLSWIISGLGSLIASHISTDGLYGLDYASFLWRGYGLSSQLFAMLWLPLAIAYAWRLFNRTDEKITIPSTIPTILSLTATTAGHLGIGIIAFMSIAVLSVSSPFFLLLHSLEIPTRKNKQDIFDTLKTNVFKLLSVYTGVLLLLGYWIFPILKDGAYHNISVWDPIWKFDSYGYREVLKNLFNGDLFDFGRLPILTILTFIGVYCAVSGKIVAADSSSAIRSNEVTNKRSVPLSPYAPFTLLFLFWLLFYFGRTTWGGLINLIPSMEEFHLSRFIVGLHITGLFLIPIALAWLSERVSKKLSLYAFTIVTAILLITSVYQQTIRYNDYNNTLIQKANDNYAKVSDDTKLLLTTLKDLEGKNPSRVYFGRGGTWGKEFRVAETPMYLYMSTFGIPTLTWLPETWSPNSDTEQYFSENVLDHYALYNVGYVVTPIDLPKDNIQPFWKLLRGSKTWNIYTVETKGYITPALRPAIVSADKQSFRNVVRLWIQGSMHAKNLYPELTFDTRYPKTRGLPNFRMTDETTFKVPDGSLHNIFATVPSYQAVQTKKVPTITTQSDDHDMVFTTTVDVPEGCTECIVVLHQTYHPSWQATIDGKPAKTFAVFPFYTAVITEDSGNHEVIFTYRQSSLKTLLLFVTLCSTGFFAWSMIKRRKN